MIEPYEQFGPTSWRPVDPRDAGSELVRWASPAFSLWTGPSPGSSYGGKAILNFNGEPAFAEIGIINTIRHHWAAVWLSQSFGKVIPRNAYWNNAAKPNVPTSVLDLIRDAHAARGDTHRGTWDIIAWPREQNSPSLSELRFIESKRRRHDEIDEWQVAWYNHLRSKGLSRNAFMIVEWELAT